MSSDMKEQIAKGIDRRDFLMAGAAGAGRCSRRPGYEHGFGEDNRAG